MLRIAVVASLLLYKAQAGKLFSLDSEDATSTQSWDGMVVLVQSDENDEPEIVISSDVDAYSLAYCLTLEELFEAETYDVVATSDKFGDYDEVSNSEIDFQNDVTWTYAEGADGASFTLTGVPTDPTQDGDHSVFSSMTFSFQVATSDTYNTTYGIEYTFALSGYEWTSSSAVLVLVFEFKACGDEFSSSDFSAEDTTDTEDDTEVDTETRRRRRRSRRRRMARLSRGRALLQETDETDDTETEESDDGISEDDSNELDLGVASFVNHGTASCVNSTVEIPTHLVYGGVLSSDEMHMVFEHFTCSDIEQDPWMGLISSKRTDAGNHLVAMYAVVVAVFAYFLQ
mmetsp:Transcript_9943/g.15948  ORF Transcript_9943/g.15948 Transcript_9943/m.15948 type:complete len:343 (+) Transcript_9943:101-1129(+)